MTTPGGSAPDGAYVIGTEFGQDQNETTVRASIRQPVINPWSLAQFNWRDMFEEKFDAVANLKDGQNAYKDRLDLLERTSGFVAGVMGQNWLVPLGRWVGIPFGVQVGPRKRTAIDTANGRLTLKAGGLWRVDVLANCRGYTRRWVPGSSWGGVVIPDMYYYYPLAVSFLLEILSGSGAILTSREFKAQASGVEYQSVGIPDDSRMLATSAAFSHTFVLENMPGQEAETGATSGWAYARLRMFAADTSGGIFNSTHCSIYGGTTKSALTATRWSRDAINLVAAPTVPDGGVLT